MIAFQGKLSNGISKLAGLAAGCLLSCYGLAQPIELDEGVVLHPPFAIEATKTGAQIEREWRQRGALDELLDRRLSHGIYGKDGNPYILIWRRDRDATGDEFPSAKALAQWGKSIALTKVQTDPLHRWVAGAVPSEDGLAGRVVVVWLADVFLYIGLYSSDGDAIDEVFELLLERLQIPAAPRSVGRLPIYIAIISMAYFIAYIFVRRR